jgi:prevent-host-death family protein
VNEPPACWLVDYPGVNAGVSIKKNWLADGADTRYGFTMFRDRLDVHAHDAEARFSELLGRVERGAEINIVKNGIPVARLMPVAPPCTAADRRAAIERILDLSHNASLGGLRIRDLKSEGRR